MKERKDSPVKKLLILLAPLGAIAVVFNSWFLHFGVRTAGDWSYMLDVTANTLRRFYFSTWLSDNQFGRVLIDAGQAPTYAVYGWLTHYFGTSYAFNERLIHLWPAVLFAVFGSYFLVKYIFNDRPTAVLGSIVYAANTYYLALLTGHLTLAGAYAFAPLVILTYLKAIGRKDIVQIVLCAVTFAISGAYEPRSATILAGVLIMLAVYHFLFIYIPKHRFSFWPVVRMLAVYFAPLVLFGLMNAYWLLGLKFAGGAGSGGVIESSLFGNEFFNISETFTLLHPFWSGGVIEPFILHNIPVYFWLIPIAAITGFALNRRSRIILFFMLLGMLGILLSKQSDGPFPSLYYWLFKNVPGFNLFREASKFYILITLAYTILIPSLYWYVKRKYRDKKYLSTAVFIGIAMLFLPNLIPVATSKIGATFSPRTMPTQYTELNNFLNTDNFERVLWVPQKSRWGLVSSLHPTVSASKLLSDAWRDLSGSFATNNNATTTDEISTMLQQKYLPVLLSNAGIKYVVIPMRDIANSDNFFRSYNDDPEIFNKVLADSPFLQKSQKQVSGFHIYETKQPVKPYFSSTTNIFSVDSSDDLATAYDLFKDTDSPVFMINDKTKSTHKTAYSTDVTDLYAGYTLQDLQHQKLPAGQTDPTKQTNYYFDQAYRQTSYTANASQITITQKALPQPTGIDESQPTQQTLQLDHTKTYMLKTGDILNKVSRKSDTVQLGAPRDTSALYSVDSKSILPKATKATGLWQKEPEDCVPYGSKKADIAMSSQMDGSINQRVISMSATNHAACTGPDDFTVRPGAYVLHFRYRGISAQMISYQVSFNTGQVVTKTLSIDDAAWHTYDALVDAPEGATSAKLRLIVRPSNQVKDTAMVYFAEPQFSAMTKVADIDSATGKLQQTAVASDKLDAYKGYGYENQLKNGSFEQGLWQSKVGDCNAFNTKSDLKMSLNKRQASDGKNSLQLEAREHTACTNIRRISVQGGATYHFQFDYQSPNADAAGFNMSFDDKAATYIEEKLPIKGTGWQTYSKTITLPSDVHQLNLAVFAFSSDDDKSEYIVNRYDNFVLQQVPDIKNRFYAVSNSKITMAQPKRIDFKQVSNTKKTVSITGATKPFVLLMSEQYSPVWQLSPALSSTDHMKVNGFENAWFIQPAEICSAHPSSCTKQADGSYDMHLSVQFTAQKWFNIGLVISTTTLLGCLAVALGVTLYRRRQESEITEDEHEKTRQR